MSTKHKVYKLPSITNKNTILRKASLKNVDYSPSRPTDDVAFSSTAGCLATAKTIHPWFGCSRPGTLCETTLLVSRKQTSRVRVSLNKQPSSTTKVVVSDTTEIQKSVNVKAVLTIQVSSGGFLSSIGINEGLDSITGLLGKSLLLELVSAELDSDFGTVGGVLVENENHKEMFLKDIVLEFTDGTAVNFTCNSWLHSKYDNPHKRVFFTNKSYLPSETPSGLRRLREEELQILRGNGQGERKTFDRIYDYDVYNDIGNPDKDTDLKRPVLGGKEHPYPRRCRTGRPRCETGERVSQNILPRLIKAIDDSDEILRFETLKLWTGFFWFRDEFARQTRRSQPLFYPIDHRMAIEKSTRPTDGTLRPLAIELTRPPIGEKPQWKEVYTPCWNATGFWLWRLAKAHVLAHDSGYHQLVSHWLRTHCATEPYIIATNRQLSAMHPIYRLLHPHFRYTMEINALARQALINAGGIIETSFSPGKYSTEFSSAAYDKQWRFDLRPCSRPNQQRNGSGGPECSPRPEANNRGLPFANDGLVLGRHQTVGHRLRQPLLS
ncbi:hypothetical protein FNV43_RR09632 [Rhamnella rubrinervis]|uniref:Lipoxygenase n=1 Tax=Rhamnella rubrinervis TaxID=2594499 RepID=A0A8K0HAS5_9ROSA|nr:hypothetical protein FNV43_RR09632 [Rhamnella rubrinervis]